MRQRFAHLRLVLGLTPLWTFVASGQIIVRTQEPRIQCTAEQAADGERYLQSHPADYEMANCALFYYIQDWARPDLHGDRHRDRLGLIRWVIENRPDLQPYDLRSLRINPADEEDYAEVRALWLRQVERFPNNAQVLANAADCLALTDREAAAMWLQTARKLQPLNGVSIDGVWIDRLARVYAAGIAGISGEPPRGPITSVDHAETESAFARLAMKEAGREAILAAVTGRELHNYAKNLRYAKLSTEDCDSKAEELMLKSVALDYPNPARVPVLRDFYQDRRVQPNVATIDAPANEQARQLVSPDWALVTIVGQSERDVHAAFRVLVDVMIGIDGHVWKAISRDSPTESVGRAAREVAERLYYRPQRVDGQPVQVATQVEVTVEPYGTHLQSHPR